jgi:hypothetical protein
MSGKAKNKELMLPTVRLLYHLAKLADFQHNSSYLLQETIVPAGFERTIMSNLCTTPLMTFSSSINLTNLL